MIKESGGTQLRIFRQEEHGPTFCAEFETPKYFLEFRAWDFGCCLDLLALNKDTGRDVYVMAGPCDGIEGFSARFDSFLLWFAVNEPKRDA